MVSERIFLSTATDPSVIAGAVLAGIVVLVNSGAKELSMGAGTAWPDVIVIAERIESDDDDNFYNRYRIYGRDGYTVYASTNEDGVTTLT
jgi:hypothetical protein